MLFNNTLIEKLKYEEFSGKTQGNTNNYKNEQYIDGLRLKGEYKVVTDKDGEHTTCNIVYKTNQLIKKNSKLDGHIVYECHKVPALGLNAGYISYCK
jgi:hypothetical protein